MSVCIFNLTFHEDRIVDFVLPGAKWGGLERPAPGVPLLLLSHPLSSQALWDLSGPRSHDSKPLREFRLLNSD
jgi:hypothetical protein